jgi:hypothetical protein
LRRSRYCCEQRERGRSITSRASWPGYATTPGTGRSRTSGTFMPARAGRRDAGLGKAALMPARTRQAARPGASAGRARPRQHGAAGTSRRGRDTAWPGRVPAGRGRDSTCRDTTWPGHADGAGSHGCRDTRTWPGSLAVRHGTAGRRCIYRPDMEPGRGGELGRRRPRTRMPADSAPDGSLRRHSTQVTDNHYLLHALLILLATSGLH